jgi:hypothetical protein
MTDIRVLAETLVYEICNFEGEDKEWAIQLVIDTLFKYHLEMLNKAISQKSLWTREAVRKYAEDCVMEAYRQ